MRASRFETNSDWMDAGCWRDEEPPAGDLSCQCRCDGCCGPARISILKGLIHVERIPPLFRDLAIGEIFASFSTPPDVCFLSINSDADKICVAVQRNK